MSATYNTDELRRSLEALPQIASVGEMKVENDIVKYIAIETGAAGSVTAQQLDTDDAPALFDFYFKGLSERPRRLFIPYPLFHTPPSCAAQLAQRIADWKKEDDWSAIKLVKDKQIIGLGLLKRFRTEQVTSAVAIRDDFLKMGLGYLLQTIIIGQARLLSLKRFHVKVISDNIASVRLHQKCGFKKAGTVPWDGYEGLLTFLNESDYEGKGKAADRHIIEMVIELKRE